MLKSTGDVCHAVIYLVRDIDGLCDNANRVHPYLNPSDISVATVACLEPFEVVRFVEMTDRDLQNFGAMMTALQGNGCKTFAELQMSLTKASYVEGGNDTLKALQSYGSIDSRIALHAVQVTPPAKPVDVVGLVKQHEIAIGLCDKALQVILDKMEIMQQTIDLLSRRIDSE